MGDHALPMIGERIRTRRRKLRMSLDELAERTDLSKSFLSQIERAISSPSIESLELIAGALEVPMFLFFVEDDADKIVTRRDEQRNIGVPDSRFQYKSVWFGSSRKMEILIGHLNQPRGHSADALTSVDECFIVLQGKLEFQLDEESYVLEEGDSAYFNGTVPHRYTALGEEELVLLFAIAPPAMSR
jgi:transcriptional regulator with XRE-family HTH domain